MKPRRASVKLIYKEKDITSDIKADIESISHEGNAADNSDSMSVTINAMEDKWLNKWMPTKGTTLDGTIFTHDWPEEGQEGQMNGGVMTVHVRSESSGLIEAVEEMLGVVRASGVRCVISHHKATGGSANWGKTAKTLELIQKINAEGYDVFTDQYPYTASATGLSTNIPDDMFTLGTDKLIAMLSSAQGRNELRPLILGALTPKERFKYTMIGSSPAHPEYNGRMLNDIADELNIDPYELQCDILRDDKLLTGGIYHTMSEDDLKRVMQYRRTMVGTDGMWYPGCGGCHPRSIGTFPRVLGRYVREKQYITLPEAIRRMTSLPAQVYGLKDKGLIVKGYDADMVLFDADKIIDRADYGAFRTRCEGLNYVIVGGKTAAENAVFTGAKAGRIIRRP